MTNIVLTTLAPKIPVLEDIVALVDWSIGAVEADGHCVYIVNPDKIYQEQGHCEHIHSCSHWFAVAAYSAGLSGHCKFRYSQCPSEIGPSSPAAGWTRFDCRDHPWIRKTCVKTSEHPMAKC